MKFRAENPILGIGRILAPALGVKFSVASDISE